MKNISIIITLISFLIGSDAIINLFKQVNNNCVTYDFELNKTDNDLKPFRNKRHLKLVASALDDHDFSFDKESDTIIVFLEYTNYLVSGSRFCGYFPTPISIHAFSSCGETHLFLDDDYTYKRFADNSRLSLSTPGDSILQYMKNNDIYAFTTFYQTYFEEASDSSPGDHLRIIIQDGRVASASNWVFFLTYFF